MAGLPLIAGDFPAVRAAINITLDAALLPDATIQLPVFQAAGEDDVRAIDPDADTRGAPLDARIRRAAIFFVASRIVLSNPDIVEESFGEQRTRLATISPAEKAADLREKGLAEVSAVLEAVGVTITARRGTHFTLAGGRRGY